MTERHMATRRPALPLATLGAAAVGLLVGAVATWACARSRGPRPGAAGERVPVPYLEQKLARERLARRVAEANSRLKGDMLFHLGHELRNPLSAIAASLEVLRRAEPKGPVAERARAVVERQTRRLVDLVDELLEVAHVMAGDVKLQVQPLALAGVVGAAVVAARPAAEERGHVLGLGDVEPVEALADVRRMAQVMKHLLDQAIRQAPPGSSVEVGLRACETGASITVRRSNPGAHVPAAAPSTDLFDPSGPDRAVANAGIGFGLTLVKRLVELQGGSVRGRVSADGAAFEIRLPGA